MKKVYFPSKTELMEAVVEAIKINGGECDVVTINKTVIDILDLPDEVVQLEDESGLGTKLDYRLRWARTELKANDVIKNVKRGTWALSNSVNN